MVIDIDEGGMWESPNWEIQTDVVVKSLDGGKPCKHSRVNATGRTWICPYIVVARNEGGCNSTGICLECIMENGLKAISKARE